MRKYSKRAIDGKSDIESAFRLLPGHPDSFRPLGCYWQEQFYVDKCLPMGCFIYGAMFEAFSSFREWVVRDVSGLDSVIHYCLRRVCDSASHVAALRGQVFGVPLAEDKQKPRRRNSVCWGDSGRCGNSGMSPAQR